MRFRGASLPLQQGELGAWGFEMKVLGSRLCPGLGLNFILLGVSRERGNTTPI